MIPNINHPPHLPPNGNQDEGPVERSRGLFKQIFYYSGLAAIVAAVSSGILLTSDDPGKQKLAEKPMTAYVILEMVLIASAIALVALKIGPMAYNALKGL